MNDSANLFQEKTSHFTLTRFLYARDEVILSLVCALLKKTHLAECYYWAFELFYSKENIFTIFWTIFFDFYAEFNPKLESYIRKKQIEWNTHKQTEPIAAIVRNLYSAKATDTVFMLRQYLIQGGNINRMIKGRSPAWVKKYAQPFRPWLISIHKGYLENIAYYTKTIINTYSSNVAFEILMSFFAERIGVMPNPEKLEVYWDSRPYPCDMHYLLSVAIHLRVPASELPKRSLFILPTTADLAWIEQSEQPTRPDKTLGIRRIFAICPYVSAFTLARQTTDATNASRLHWEYHSAKTPLWFERIYRCGGTICNKTKTIEFKDEDKLEEFYSQYGYEFDEQPIHVQNKSIQPLERVHINDWWKTFFNCTPRISFLENAVMQY
tara:strand:- start:96 stop:1238 length:1143 start_codon:yes stop_codon:yes gene_type:complete